MTAKSDNTIPAALPATDPLTQALNLLDKLALSCTRAEDAGFWILTSAAFHISGEKDEEPSTAEAFFWSRQGGAE